MTSKLELNQCSTCQKSSGKCMCDGCKNYFCMKHFEQHRQQLSIKFDDEIAKTHDELREQINRINQSSVSTSEFFNEIDRWETVTVEKIHKAANQARRQLTQLFTRDKDTLAKEFGMITKEIRDRREEDNFDENDIERIRQTINQMKISLKQFIQPTKTIIVTNDRIDWNRFIYVENEHNRVATLRSNSTDIHLDAEWVQNSITVAGGNGQGREMNQLFYSWGLYVNDEQTIFVADTSNHRIMEWKYGAMNGQVVAGGNRQGNGTHQLNNPYDVIVDKKSDSLIISDCGNKRVVRWPCQNGTSGETIISNIDCIGLAIDENGSLYVVDHAKHEVRRYSIGDTEGTVVAGGRGKGNRLDQLANPYYVFVDRDHSVYVSDHGNHRVMKWKEDAKQGIVVAGGQGSGDDLTQLSNPRGIFVDELDTVYVADGGNHRIMRWPKEATQGCVIAGGNDSGGKSNQLNNPVGLSIDRHGNLYVVDKNNSRVQKFNIDSNS